MRGAGLEEYLAPSAVQAAAKSPERTFSGLHCVINRRLTAPVPTKVAGELPLLPPPPSPAQPDARAITGISVGTVWTVAVCVRIRPVEVRPVRIGISVRPVIRPVGVRVDVRSIEGVRSIVRVSVGSVGSVTPGLRWSRCENGCRRGHGRRRAEDCQKLSHFILRPGPSMGN